MTNMRSLAALAFAQHYRDMIERWIRGPARHLLTDGDLAARMEILWNLKLCYHQGAVDSIIRIEARTAELNRSLRKVDTGHTNTEGGPRR